MDPTKEELQTQIQEQGVVVRTLKEQAADPSKVSYSLSQSQIHALLCPVHTLAYV